MCYAVPREIRGLKVSIVGLNSAWSCGRDGEKGRLWLGGRWQIGHLRPEFDKADMRIVLMHHPLDWFHEKEVPGLRPLFQRDFHFFLHGHEHEGWVDGPLPEGHTRIAAAACYDRSDRPNGYNFVRLNLQTGRGEVRPRHFEPAGGRWRPHLVGKTDDTGKWSLDRLDWLYDKARTLPRPAAGSAAGWAILSPVRCRLYSKRWDLILPQGDLIGTEVFWGLRSSTGHPVDSLSLFSSAEGLSHSRLIVKSLTHGYDVSVQESVAPGSPDQPRQVTYRLRFEPTLKDQDIDILCRRESHGAAFSSVKDQEYGGVPEDRRGWEGGAQVVGWECDRMLLSLRFVGDINLAPSQVMVDPNTGDSDPGPGSQSEKIIWDYWSPDILKDPDLQKIPSTSAVPEVILAVDHPHINTRYNIRWRLPDHEIPNWANLLHLRERLFKLDEDPALHAEAKNHLEEFLVFLRDRMLKLHLGVDWSAPSLRAYIFAFDETTANLVCRVATGPDPGNPFENLPISWGRDVIGWAFRCTKPAGLSRAKQSKGSWILNNLPPAIQALIAFPMLAPDFLPYQPVGVAVIASDSPTSGLHLLVEKFEQIQVLFDKIDESWGLLRSRLIS